MLAIASTLSMLQRDHPSVRPKLLAFDKVAQGNKASIPDPQKKLIRKQQNAFEELLLQYKNRIPPLHITQNT